MSFHSLLLELNKLLILSVHDETLARKRDYDVTGPNTRDGTIGALLFCLGKDGNKPMEICIGMASGMKGILPSGFIIQDHLLFKGISISTERERWVEEGKR